MSDPESGLTPERQFEEDFRKMSRRLGEAETDASVYGKTRPNSDLAREASQEATRLRRDLTDTLANHILGLDTSQRFRVLQDLVGIRGKAVNNLPEARFSPDSFKISTLLRAIEISEENKRD